MLDAATPNRDGGSLRSHLAWAAGGLFSAAVGIGVAQLHKGHWGVTAWSSSNYFANYDQEFLKRALWGELFTTLVPRPTRESIEISGSVVLALAILAVAFHLASSFQRICRVSSAGGMDVRPVRRLWFPALVFFPALFPQLGYELGRVDHLNLVGFVLSIWLARSRRRWMRFLTVPISVAAILTHEAYLIIQLPVVIGILTIESYRRTVFERNSVPLPHSAMEARLPWRLEPAIMLLVCVAAAFVVLIFGSASIETHARIEDAMREAGFDMTVPGRWTTIWVYSLADTIAQTFHRYATLAGGVYFAVFCAFGAAVSWVYSRIVRALGVWSGPPEGDLPKWAKRYLVFSPFAVLILLFVGFDGGRWFGWMAVNQVFVSLYLIEIIPNDRRRAAALGMVPKRSWAAAFLGPLGVGHAFPLLSSIAQRLLG